MSVLCNAVQASINELQQLLDEHNPDDSAFLQAVKAKWQEVASCRAFVISHLPEGNLLGDDATGSNNDEEKQKNVLIRKELDSLGDDATKSKNEEKQKNVLIRKEPDEPDC